MRPDVAETVLGMYQSLERAGERQGSDGNRDRGHRAEVTSGRHLDPLAELIKGDLVASGFHEDEVISTGNAMRLPGWFRKSKDWDLLALDDGRLVSAIELKSINSSFGNNANNRTEESLGSALDALTAADEGLMGDGAIPPVLGYVMVMRDCPAAHGGNSRVRTVFPTDPVFDDTTYIDRFRILCERLRSKSIYQAVWFVTADPEHGVVSEPSPDLTYEKFIASIVAALHINRA